MSNDPTRDTGRPVGPQPPFGPSIGDSDERPPSLFQIHKTFSALNISAYRYLWASMLTSFLGMQMQFIARSILAYDLGGNAGSIAIVNLGWAIPMLVFSLLGGAIADRMDRRKLMMLSQGGTALLSCLTAVMIQADVMTLFLLFAVGLFQGTIFSFSAPARSAFLPQVVGEKELMNAIALNSAGMNLTGIAGPTLGGALVAFPFVGIAGVFFIQAALNVVAALLLAVMPRGVAEDVTGEEHPRGTIHGELMDGLRYVWHSPILLTLLLMGLVPSLLGMSTQSFLPIWAKKVFGDGIDANSGGFGLMMAMIGAGALAGSLLVAAMQEYPKRTQLQLVAGVAYGASIAFFAVQGSFGLALAGLIGLGISANYFMALNSTLIMTSCDSDYYGRVMSVNMMTFALMPLGTLPMGFIADLIGRVEVGPVSLIGVQVTSAFAGLAIVAFILFVTVLNPAYRRLQHEDFKEFAQETARRLRERELARDEVVAAGS